MLSALALGLLLGRATAAQEVCGSFHDPMALEGTIVGRVPQSVIDASEDGFSSCIWQIFPEQRLKYIEFNTSSSQIVDHDALAFYTGRGRNGMHGLISTFTGLRGIPKEMVLTGSDEVYLVLTATSNASHFHMKYRCMPTGDIQVLSMHISPLWLTLWLIVVVLLVCICCGISAWLLRHRRALRRERQAARETMLVLHSELMRRRSEARRAQLEAAEQREEEASGALHALPTQAWHVVAVGQTTAACDPDESPECCLCMERFEESDEVRVLPCSHYFHKDCVDRWFATKRYQARSCPLCKRDPLISADGSSRPVEAMGNDGSLPDQPQPAEASAEAGGEAGAAESSTTVSAVPATITDELQDMSDGTVTPPASATDREVA